MNTQIIEVPLSRIEASPTNPRKYFNPQKLEELATSIRTVGLIQAVTLRTHPKKKDHYELVCGERRFRASKLAELSTIPAQVRDLTDDQVQELQFVENIEREDVHPMDEAVTFSAMMANKTRPWTVDDIAAKINKPASYVVQRMQLTRLIPQLQKHFWDGKFLIGHAVLFARLTEADQKMCLKNWSVIKNGEYEPVKKVEHFIEENILRKLSSAPFKRDDEKLLPEAGPCTTCPKRSGCNLALFADIKADDRCFDASCFEKKKVAWLVRESEKILTTKPDVLLLHYGYGESKVPPVIAKLAAQYKVHILNYNRNEFQTYSGTGYTKRRGLWISGHNAGTYEAVYLKSAGSTAKKNESVSKVIVKEKIQDRLERGLELDYEKEQKQIVDLLKKQHAENPVSDIMLNFEVRELFINYFLYEKLGWSSDLREQLQLEEADGEDYDEDPAPLFAKLRSLKHEHADALLVANLLDAFGNRNRKSAETAIIRLLARQLGVDVDGIEAAQAAIRAKREGNAQKRIAALDSDKGEGLKKAKAGKQKTEKQRA